MHACSAFILSCLLKTLEATFNNIKLCFGFGSESGMISFTCNLTSYSFEVSTDTKFAQ